MKTFMFVVVLLSVFLLAAYLPVVYTKEWLAEKLAPLGIDAPKPLGDVVIDALLEARDRYSGHLEGFLR